MWEFMADRRFVGALTVIGVVVAILTFAFGDGVWGGRDEPQPSVTTPQARPDGQPLPSSAPNSPATSTRQSTSERTTEPISDPSTSTPSAHGTSPAHVVYNDSVNLDTSEGINLDTGTTKIQRGVSITDGDSMDLYVDGWANGNLKAAPIPDGQGLFFKSRSGSLEDCTSLIERGQGATTSAVPETTSHLWYCFLTSEHQVTAARIGARKDDGVPVSVTVWDRVLNP
ncbi:hypothetical protein [Actinoplanes sp. NPDC026619]|uniref:hypothetical protein n=1 Tax=Actinoplanes sp. NPDC026619 TaxID=3155798 RepID=UPI0033D1A5C7